MLLKIIIILMLLAIFASLFSALFYLLRGDKSDRTVKALTWRISISLTLFLLLMTGFYFGVVGVPNPRPF
jgi:Protein of unknown function (DUF2909)